MEPGDERWILAIADDLTGALEAGARFAGHGLRSRVTTDLNITRAPGVRVVVIDTETRHLSEREAAEVVGRVAENAQEFTPWLIYKKTDSTLRGNIASEFRVLLDVFSQRKLVYAPAYPEMGRTVRDGDLFVGGIPVHQSEFARDALNPVHESGIRAMLGDVPACVLDGETDGDVQTAARMIVDAQCPPIAAGPAVLAGALAECIGRGAGSTWPRVSRCLVVNGSLHPASAAQIDAARRDGCFEDGWSCFQHDAGGAGLERAMRTAEHVRQAVESEDVDALVVFGGDTAFGIHRALGAEPFEPYGEILPGVPVSHCGGLTWITKAGGFGAPGLLCDIRKRLT